MHVQDTDLLRRSLNRVTLLSRGQPITDFTQSTDCRQLQLDGVKDVCRMLEFIKRIGQWPPGFKVLYLLIIFDGVATYYGLSLKVIMEANPIMAAAFEFNPLLTLIFKLVLSVFFLNYIHYCISEKNIRWPLKVMPLLLLIHGVVAALHLYWIRMVLA